MMRRHSAPQRLNEGSFPQSRGGSNQERHQVIAMLLLTAFIEEQRLPVQFAKTLCFDIAKWMSGEIASLEEMKVSIHTVSGAIAELVAAARVRDKTCISA